jgi:TonB family protein
MSRYRLTSSLAAFVAALALAGWLGVRSFPLQAAPQGNDSPNVAAHTGPLPLLHRAAVIYPNEAQTKGVTGTVVLELSLSESGSVTDARVISGPEELRRAALESVLQWHYAHERQLPPKTQVSIDFRPATELMPAMLMPPPDEIAQVDRLTIQAPEPIKQKLESRITLHEGDRITQATLNDLTAAISDVDEHLKLALYPNAAKTGSIIFITLEGPASSNTGKRIRVNGKLQAAKVVRQVAPVYPVEAKQNRIQGIVRFAVIIGKDGAVKNVALLSGDALLAEAAKAAVEQWVYRPTLLNGEPIEVATEVDVNFTLAP